MSMTKELKSLLKTAEDQGCRVVITPNNHYKVYVPGGKLVVISSTPSDNRAIENIKRDLRSAGIVIIKKNRRK
jgi:hypothetical protein